MANTKPGPDKKHRCAWCIGVAEFLPYHDSEWGFPVDDDIRLFEKLCLEGFQAGLSWRTILAKRENFRRAFAGFDFRTVARFGARDVQRLLKDAGIVRHRGKIEAVINNARRALEMAEREGSLAAWFWRHEPGSRSLQQSPGKPPAASAAEVSAAVSKSLKKQGWRFVGPTTVYSFMQAMGLVNDHAEGCVVRAKVARARKAFSSPAQPGKSQKPVKSRQ
jgi:DNA-3-methyladenine glycosylase I